MPLSIIILAAGQGTRMRSDLPKVLQTLAGRPMLSHVLECARALQAADICVVYGHGGETVPSTIGQEDLRWVLQAEQHGTGHAVQQAMPETPPGNRALILFGDVPLLTVATLTRLLEDTPADGVAVLTVDLHDPYGYGRIVRDGERVVGIVEQKDATPAQRAITEINTGVMVCPAGRLGDWLQNLSNDNAQGEYYLTDVVAMAVRDGVDVRGVKASNRIEVMGINDKKQLAEAERALQARLVDELMAEGVGFADPARVDIRGKLTCGKDVFIDVNAVFEGDVSLGDGSRIESNNLIRDSKMGPGTVVHSNCHIEGATTGRDCEIGPFARMRPGAALSNNVKVGNFVEIKKSTVADGSKINHLTYIGDAEVGAGVNVGAGTITCNYDGANKYKTTIGDDAFIGSGVNLVAPVEIGKGATIGAGSTITKPAAAGELTLGRAKQMTIKGWKKPVKKGS
ncbi:MAG: bifunctional UDP-N-acetylglucosamine diphosphorylase/glucosamine-1-phosphate N-acetyltransferase GlmU [Gammaproteobacteria bacterium]|nr:bifunctional UDP-N-acetylglucosamine diphosphorylase/glucosamine-1-phosphate N-acetyltransferase GlmU [Gammaproteobacteria bacterium]MDH3428896.1 bifunctional UDP-N-acetylglucosamine diphosphorylase/glucosamine-1-phosphate N-acetyltransferase GlmU [Gammaproteobacteria bacterium]MDH3432941.1 bifunctional UDP-N-acetylglucosamine diphosphorylase/glucosamine-1-phosphate N-acetyltransferase GlmU [Gammaproteobacteria bacterium]